MKTRLLVLLCLLNLPLATELASASEFNYNYVQIGHVSSTDDSLGVNIDYSAVGISGSFEIDDDFALTASFASGSYDDIPVDTNDLSAGITFHTAINPDVDIFINGSLVQVGLETPIGDDDDSGTGGQAGIRHIVTDDAEFDAYFSQVSIFNETSNAIGFGLRINISKALSLRLGYSTGDNVEGTSVKLRLEI